jgi:hypothetical protein
MDEEYVQEHNLRIESSPFPMQLHRCKASAKSALGESVRPPSKQSHFARVLSWSCNRGVIAANPSERGAPLS